MGHTLKLDDIYYNRNDLNSLKTLLDEYQKVIGILLMMNIDSRSRSMS